MSLNFYLYKIPCIYLDIHFFYLMYQTVYQQPLTIMGQTVLFTCRVLVLLLVAVVLNPSLLLALGAGYSSV